MNPCPKCGWIHAPHKRCGRRAEDWPEEHSGVWSTLAIALACGILAGAGVMMFLAYLEMHR